MELLRSPDLTRSRSTSWSANISRQSTIPAQSLGTSRRSTSERRSRRAASYRPGNRCSVPAILRTGLAARLSRSDRFPDKLESTQPKQEEHHNETNPNFKSIRTYCLHTHRRRFRRGLSNGRHDGTQGSEVDGAHVERPDGPSWEGRADAPD